ncbi:MAG: SPFH domain-containing protein [Lachnospiraceae bacterium]|nr:SPFH domain-containing protein [Lachnospiraceae bacterium]
MSNLSENSNTKLIYEERDCKSLPGMPCLILNSLVIIAFIALFVLSIIALDSNGMDVLALTALIVSALYSFVVGPIIYAGLKVVGPNEALVLTFFGKYHGTLKGPGFFQVNPFVVAINPAAETSAYSTQFGAQEKPLKVNTGDISLDLSGSFGKKKKISLKAMTLNNDMQKINDKLGNPIIIGIVVVWKVTNTAKAVFNVDNYKEFLSIQCDSALRNIIRLYPYDIVGNEGEDGNEKSLRGSSDEVANSLKEEIQAKVELAGLEITEARITNLSYAPEIAAAMLQRQQASAVVDARTMIVDGAVGMVEMALARLSDSNIVNLDEERKAAMVSNLLVVLCGNRDAQPIVNSGSLY